MNRREFTQRTLFYALAVSIPRGLEQNSYWVASAVKAPKLELPAGKRVPFGWPAFAVLPDKSGDDVILHFPKPIPQKPLRLRLTVAIDTREAKKVEVRSAQTNQWLGELDLRFSYATELYEVLLSTEKAAILRQEGIRLRMVSGTSPIWFLAPAKNPDYAGLQPHVLADTAPANPETAFWSNLGSLRSIQQFSWMEGCVTDGLLDWWLRSRSTEAKKALESHFALFFDDQQRLVYENARSEPADGTIYGIECPLPLAALAQRQTHHPALDLLVSFARQKSQPNGLIQDQSLTTEGCYTLAYPLAVLARQRQDVELARLALANLHHRQEALVTPDVVYQGRNQAGEWNAYPNWGRGLVWYLLGTVRTLNELNPLAAQLDPTVLQNLKATFLKTAERMLKDRDAQGGWHGFVGEPQTGIDTSATAGIAAALALATQYGWMPSETFKTLEITKKALFQYLTPDGFLTGACQSNRGGVELQRSGYRVISQYAAGLMAQFLVAMKT
ncbi:glycoside hydrolase family 88 protein [Larkinella sp. C7]|jgi:unsaturated rhamnogalacturonyl hydrolase|uniref:glycoside hydrolase family 88 protein n=1 Tax=Larkinella sp. C7 TaxID=2576607 RepID=UPI0011111AB0|nr:glycoside hydrolase family 88 protein [Larkinella sp. C7]